MRRKWNEKKLTVFLTLLAILSLIVSFLVVPIVSFSEEKPGKTSRAIAAQERLDKINTKYKKTKNTAGANNSVMPNWAPEGFPFPDKTVVSHHSGNLHGGVVNLKSNLSIDEVNQFYLEALPMSGWQKGKTQKREYYHLFKKNSQQAIITILKYPTDDFKSLIKLTIVM